jgi:hypothetical protein
LEPLILRAVVPYIVFTDAGGAAFFERPIDEGTHAREAGEVGVDEFLRDLRGDADARRSSLRSAGGSPRPPGTRR